MLPIHAATFTTACLAQGSPWAFLLEAIMATRCAQCGTALVSATVPIETLTGRWHPIHCPRDPKPYSTRARAYEANTRRPHHKD
jgi:hypothetical protein